MQRFSKGLELESKCYELFVNLGWQVNREVQNTHRFDLELRHNNEFFGYVELFLNLNQKQLKNKVALIRKTIEETKTPLLVVSDGVVFDVYYFGRYVGRRLNPPNPEGVKIILEYGYDYK